MSSLELIDYKIDFTGRVFASVAHNRRRRTLAATTRRAVALHGLAPQASTSALDAAGVLDVPQESAAGRQAATLGAQHRTMGGKINS